MNVEKAIQLLDKVLTPDLLRPLYREKLLQGAHPFTGHCYVVSEVLYHLSGRELRPHTVHHEGTIHWFLRGADGAVIDPTAVQFQSPVPYRNGRGRGFLTKLPSRRAAIVLHRLSKFDG